MIKKLSTFVFALLCGAIGSHAFGSTLMGPKGQFSTFIVSLKWQPGNACFKPRKPFSRDQYAVESYRRDAIRYMQCIKDAANSDAQYASDVVVEGYNEAADDFLREVKSGY